jgi:hypothetical protein
VGNLGVAQAKGAYYNTLACPEEELIVVSEQANFDFSVLPMDEPLPDDLLESVQGARGLMERYIQCARAAFAPNATLRQLAENQASKILVRFVGDPS